MAVIKQTAIILIVLAVTLNNPPMNIDQAKLIEAIKKDFTTTLPYVDHYVKDKILSFIESQPTTEPKLPTVEEIEAVLNQSSGLMLSKNATANQILTLLKSKQPE